VLKFMNDKTGGTLFMSPVTGTAYLPTEECIRGLVWARMPFWKN